jgi:hypothetical protein
MKTTQLLAPLRQRRDRLFTLLYKGSTDEGRKVLREACIGKVDEFTEHFGPECQCDEDACDLNHSWDDEHSDFYKVCLEIKNLEAKLYDEAMKQR